MSPSKSHFLEEIYRIKKLLPISSKNLFLELKEKGPLFLILTLTLPFLQPIPIPVFSTLIAIIIMIESWAFLINSPPIILRKWENYHLTVERFSFIEKGAEKIFPIINHLIKERMTSLFLIPIVRYLSGFFLIILAIFLALPLPIPSSNFIPAIGIFFIALSHLERDGVFLLFSYFYCAVIFCLIGFGVFFLF